MTKRKVTFIDLAAKHAAFAKQYHEDLDRVLASGWFILGGEVAALEQEVAAYTGCNHAIGVANCTDALMLCLRAIGIGPGDEVITSPMSYLATTSSIALCGGTAVFVDVDDSLNLDPGQIEAAITERTRAISVVHLAGVPAQMDRIVAIADRHGLSVIEDCAQSFGTEVAGKAAGTFGRFGTLSFHPLKNLGTPGDGGMILARDASDAEWLRQARNHGHRGREECDFWSVNSRLDELHAAFLRTQLKAYPEEMRRRIRLAELYATELAGLVDFPRLAEGSLVSYNWIMMLTERRDELVRFLEERGIETKIHYPVLISQLVAAQKNCRIHGMIERSKHYVSRICSLPMAEHVTADDAMYVCENIKSFFAGCRPAA